MARQNEAERRTEGTILADSRGARKRFGFGGAPLSPITSAPKHTDQWFVEFISPTGTYMDVSGQAQNVSPITIQTTTQPVDRYGKREYVPTRVDFPEVTVTFYDTVDGKMMIFAKSIYAEFFKNQTINVDSGIQSTIEDINSGRKFGTSDTSPSTKNFSKVSLYHFFGGFDSGNGFIQRIVLVNPVVTSITFSESDYSQSGLRTITVTLQPENIAMGTPAENPAVPKWMQEGLEFILEDFDPNNMSEFEKKIIQDLKLQRHQLENGNVNISNIPSEKAYMSEQVAALQNLSKYYYEARRIEMSETATTEEKDALLKKFIATRNSMPTVSVTPGSKLDLEQAQVVPIGSKTTDLESQKTRAAEKLLGLSKPSNSPEIDTTPNVPINSDVLTSESIRQSVKDELVNAHLDGRPVNVKNVSSTDLEQSKSNGRKKTSGDKVTSKVKSHSERIESNNIGGEPYIPGQPMTENQVAAIEVSLAMGNSGPSGQELTDYNNGKENRAARIKAEKRNADTRSSKQAKIEELKRQRNRSNVQ